MKYRVKLLKDGTYLAEERRCFFLWKLITAKNEYGSEVARFFSEADALEAINQTIARKAKIKSREQAAKTYRPIVIGD